MLVPSSRASFAALVTAVHADAPPILQWDHDDERNPVSWYFYHNGSLAGAWGLEAGTFCNVTGICLKPSMWGSRPAANHGDGLFIILDGARDSRNESLSLFPETLKTELHGIRATIEAHSHARKLEGQEESSACGLGLSKGQSWSVVLRVTSSMGKVDYRLDRWD